MVFQHFGLLPWKTVYDNAAFGLAMARMPATEIKARVHHYLELVGLTGFEHHYPYQLSGGMQQRVGLVRALAVNPRVLLMDEPFAALDEITRFKLNNDLLQVWQASGTTVIFVTHSVFESVYLSNRILVMTARPGRVSAELNIEAPYPRDQNFRTSAEYAAYCRRASTALAEAIGEDAPAGDRV